MPRPLLLPSLLLLAVATQAQSVTSSPVTAPTDTLPRRPRLRITGLLTTDELPALAPTIQDQLRRVPGVQVTPYSGAPGADAVLRVRSAASLLHPTQPLFEVDGLPTLALTYGLPANTQVIFNSFGRDFNPLLLLPPGVLDSVSVQTGAAATAGYGTLGAGGVLALQTARGGGNKPVQISYNAQLTAQQLRRAYSLLDAREYAGLANEASTASFPVYSADELAKLGKGTDWQQELYGLGTDHQLRLRGQQATTRYAAQLGYLHQDGIMRKSWLNRYSAGLSLDQRLGRLDLHANALGTRLDERRPNANAAAGALLSSPTVAVRDANGEYTNELPPGKPGYLQHPLRLTDEVYSTPRTQLLLTRLAATYHLGTDWQLSASGGHDRVTQDAPNYGLAYAGGRPDLGIYRYASQRIGEQSQAVGTLMGTVRARYQHTFGTWHQLTASLEYGYQRLRYKTQAHYDYPAGPGTQNTTDIVFDEDPRTLHYQRATASYVLHEAFEWQASLWTNRWDQQRAVYPGGQFTWRAERLPALQASTWLTELHAWAAAGQSATGLYEGQFWINGPVVVIQPGEPAPPTPPAEFFQTDRRPGRTTHLELGTTLGLWQQRLRLGLTAYQRRSSHLQVPELVYYQTYPFLRIPNTLALLNRGLELTLESRWQAGRLQGLTRLAAATTTNKVTQAPENAYFQGVRTGEQLGTWTGYQQAGIVADGPRTGLVQYQVTPQSAPYADPNQPLGGGAPRHTLSLFQRLSRGRFALDVQADAMSGYQVFSETLMLLELPTTVTNSSTSVRDRWTPANQQTSTPRAGVTPPPRIDSRYLSNGAHLRLTEVVLSYRLPTTLPLTVYGGGRNLLVLTPYRGYDPNVSSAGAIANQPMMDQTAYPVPRTWLLGLNAEF